jgi:hypothetical protein
MFSRLGIRDVVRCLMFVLRALDIGEGRPSGEVAVMEVYEVDIVDSWMTTCSKDWI